MSLFAYSAVRDEKTGALLSRWLTRSDALNHITAIFAGIPELEIPLGVHTEYRAEEVLDVGPTRSFIAWYLFYKSKEDRAYGQMEDTKTNESAPREAFLDVKRRLRDALADVHTAENASRRAQAKIEQVNA